MTYTISERMKTLQPSAIREILKATADPSVISFAAGNPAPEAFPVEAVQQISAKMLAENPIGALQYSISEGYAPLRQSAQNFACRSEALMRENDRLLVVSGAQQGIELAAKCLCNEGDTVLCEQPSFIGALNTFRSYRLNLVGLPLEEDGMSIAALEEALKTHKNIRLLYTIPNFQNPTGLTTSAEKRRKIYELAARYGVLILEDDPYGCLRFSGQPVPSIKSLDTEGIVLYCGSFSKLFAPALRVAYLIAPEELFAKLVVAKQCSDVHTNMWGQLLCHELLQGLDMQAYIAGLQEIYRRKCNLMLEQLEKHLAGHVAWTKPEGGLFVWCTLPPQADMTDFCRQAVAKGVAVVPGVAFNVDTAVGSQCFRLNFSTPTDEQIIRGVALLGGLFAN